MIFLLIKSQFDDWFGQAAFNVARGMKIIYRLTAPVGGFGWNPPAVNNRGP